LREALLEANDSRRLAPSIAFLEAMQSAHGCAKRWNARFFNYVGDLQRILFESPTLQRRSGRFHLQRALFMQHASLFQGEQKPTETTIAAESSDESFGL